jgi:hypothetical protein
MRCAVPETATAGRGAQAFCPRAMAPETVALTGAGPGGTIAAVANTAG